MKTLKAIAGAAFLGLAAARSGLGCAAVANEDSEGYARWQTTVHLTVTVRTSSGHGLENVPIAYRTRGGISASKTDAEGVAAIACDIAESDSEIVVKVSPGPKPMGSLPAWQQSFDTSRQLEMTYALERYYAVALVPGKADYSLNIIARDAISVSGSVVDSQGAHPRVSVLHAGPNIATTSDVDGTFSLSGVPKGVLSEIFVAANDGSIIPVPVPPSATNVALGPIHIPARPSSQGTARITLSNWVTPDLKDNANTGVTLIAGDGSRMFSLVSRRNGDVRVGPGSDSIPAIPPGTYYVAPGMFLATPPQLRLLRALRNHADMHTALVPTLVITTGSEAVLAVDVSQTKSRVEALSN